MLAAQKEGGVPTFRDGKGNLVLYRLDSLSHSLAEAELATLDLRGQQDTILDALESPRAMRSYVEGLQFKGRDLGDREYDELRSQLVQYTASLNAMAGVLGPNHSRVRALQTTVDGLKNQVNEKEKAIADAQLADVTARLASAEQKEVELRSALEAQKSKALDLSPAAAKYARLESDVQDLQKRAELLDNRIAELNVNTVEAGPFNVRVLQPALVPEKAVKPNKALTLAAALLAGCVLGIGFASLREFQDARVRSPEEVPALLGVPLIGLVPRINRRLAPVERGQVVRLDPRSPVAEAYRSIRTSLDLGDARAARTILIASPAPGDGKSTTAGNLAIAFAQAGDRTLLLDCDLREPVQHLIFEGEASAGMSTVMPGETKLRDSILPTRVANLYLLPCGPVPRTPSEMLASDRFNHLLRTLCKAFDRVVIDSPSLEEATDGRILAAAADVTVLVLRMNQSMRRSGALALAGLNEVGANVLGVVANDVPSVAAYRIDGGPWQYAARGHDGVIATGALPRNGELRPLAGAAAHFSAEAIMIPEPDWPADERAS
jgi:capsular exopolysaccharide synthesis family protein